jgi:hypothetical protein
MPFEPHHADADPRFRRLVARLAAMSAIDRGRRSLPTAIYLAILFWDELLARLNGEALPLHGPHHPPSEALDDFLRPLGQRCRMANRDTARVRAALLALRRLDPRFSDGAGKKRRRRGGMAEFVRREFFADALLLMQITYAAEGLDLAPVAEWEAKRLELAGIPGGGRHGAAREHAPAAAGGDRGFRQERRSRSAETPNRSTSDERAPTEVRRPPASAATDAAGENPLNRRRRRRRSRRHELFGAPADDRGDPA